MKYSERITLLTLSTLLSGCNTGFRGLTLEASEFSSQAVPMKLLQYDCKLDKAFNIAAGTKFSWAATKLSGEVVTGVHNIQGTLVGDLSGPTNPQLLLDFFPESVNTSVELRNTRIRDIVFNVDLGYKLQYSANTVTHVSGPTTWPKVGESAVYTVAGSLTVSNKTTPLSFNVVVTGATDGMTITPQTVISVDVRTTLGLSAEITELLALVPGVDMQNEVKLYFTLPLKNGC